MLGLCVIFIPEAGTCQAFGDPTFLTFDGQYLTGVQSSCTHTLTETCGEGPQEFAIRITNAPNPINNLSSYIANVTLEALGYTVVITEANQIQVITVLWWIMRLFGFLLLLLLF